METNLEEVSADELARKRAALGMADWDVLGSKQRDRLLAHYNALEVAWRGFVSGSATPTAAERDMMNAIEAERRQVQRLLWPEAFK